MNEEKKKETINTLLNCLIASIRSTLDVTPLSLFSVLCLAGQLLSFPSFLTYLHPLLFLHSDPSLFLLFSSSSSFFRFPRYPKLLEHKYPELSASLEMWRKRDSLWDALKYSYLPWVFSHFVILSVHPFSPLAKYETLFDWVAGADPNERNEPALQWIGKVALYCGVHFVLAMQGMMAAALSFKYQLVHFVWILCVFFSVSFSGWKFYEVAIDPRPGDDLTGSPSVSDWKR